ncbi:hypothetical protein ZIOFF_016122 [Zingiber officinale]|uniref:Uncharacterized protein n=1 Tax=Zingiber officinale TaxID=94328 RepID=A0A8J5HKV0_ZINOF|nr:hypothetical protein ZIOFF_016122 [Zingiber officinale]
MLDVSYVSFIRCYRSSLCLQFKPRHIAAGAAFLAARTLNFDVILQPSILCCPTVDGAFLNGGKTSYSAL